MCLCVNLCVLLIMKWDSGSPFGHATPSQGERALCFASYSFLSPVPFPRSQCPTPAGRTLMSKFNGVLLSERLPGAGQGGRQIKDYAKETRELRY